MELRPAATRPLACPSCGGRIPADDVNVELMVALCRSCDRAVELAPARAAPPDALLELAAPPPGIEAHTEGEDLVLRWRWLKVGPDLFGLAAWVLFWNGFLVVWYAMAFTMLFNGEEDAVLAVVFPLIHVAVGIGAAYLLVATLVNRSEIRVGPAHITVRHGPLPWSGPAPIPTGAVDQLYVVRNRNKQGGVTYDLVARRVDRTSDALLSGIGDDVQARFLERRIEAHLGIADRPVDGEYTG